MRTTIFMTLVSLLVFTACSKDDNPGTPSGDIAQYHLYFDLLKSDGSVFEEGEWQVSIPYILNEEGQLVPINPELADYWESLRIIIEEDFFNNNPHENPEHYRFPESGVLHSSIWYGSSLLFATEEDRWVNDKYYLLRYEGYETDTLLVRDILNPGFERSFEFYLNGESIELQAFWIGDYETPPQIHRSGYITIVK